MVDEGAGGVLPHERTLSGPKEDRLKLFRATKTNLSPGFMLYRDPARALGPERLVTEAFERGARDNITAVVVRVR